MRIWDVHPGYLNRQSLLGEHRELHGIAAILDQGRKGYSAHPETRRWVAHRPALARRHRLLVAEMALRGFTDRSPLTGSGPVGDTWPSVYIDPPVQQFRLLAQKYAEREEGRIPLPRSPQALWAQHKYSVMARHNALYRELGPRVAALPARELPSALAQELVEVLRQPPPEGGIRNALQHMWGYVAEVEPMAAGAEPATLSLPDLLQAIQRRALLSKQSYLLASTALSELAAWMPEPAG